MKNSTFSTQFLIAILLLFMGWEISAQNYIPFVPRYDEAIKGDMLLIGNNNLSVHKTNAYTGNTNNENSNNRDRMVYVDIDTDNSTFNSSSADLNVPSDTGCYKVVYAALYWSAVVKGNTPMENIKFKTPGSTSYVDLTGDEIYYQNSSNIRNSNTYVYYKDITDIIGGLTNAEGTYTVANISSMTSADVVGNRNSEGLSAGWSMFVIYEDPLLPSKYITSFDGYTKIDNKGSNTEQTFLIDGFKTIPVGPVRAKYAFSALEGDKSWAGDYLEINGTKIGASTAGGTTIRPTDNFFNSSVSIIDPNTNAPTPFVDRNPASSNTLGFDAGIINIPNAGNSIIKNNDTSANIKLGTKTDIYYFYFSAFAIEIIAPKIVLTKIVEDAAGNNIGGQEVDLGTELNYVLGFQNTGNDDATNLIIRDILPQNIEFNYPQDIGILPDGVSVQSYNAATREIIFKVENRIVEIGDPVKEIRFKVTVVRECSKLNDACSNIISNQAFSTYNGTDNPNFVISDDPSFKENTGCLLTPGATNFLADIKCSFEEDVILCGANVTLTAGSGYDSYRWTDATGTVIGNTQSIIVKKAGTYYVHNTATAPCQSIDQIFNVVTYGENDENPVLPFADKIEICPNDGKKLPYIFLCGATDVREIRTNITDTSAIIWEKLNEGSCSTETNGQCANENITCSWSEVGSGPNFDVKLAGQYRVTLHYEGGCFNQYYFNVNSNLLEPTVTSKDIICDQPGEIVVGGVPNGYVYSIDGVNYQTSNTFSIAAGGKYNVTVKQVGVDSNPCIFPVPEVQIRERNFTGTAVVSQPLCYGDKGSVKLAANDAGPQYFYKLSKDGTQIHSVGPIMESDYEFANLNPGNYTATISTEDGCEQEVPFEIIAPELLTATSALTKPILPCEIGGGDIGGSGPIEGDGSDDEQDEVAVLGGIITVYPKGGTSPYYYFVNGSTEFQTAPEIVVNEPGTYTIRVVDANDCETETTIKVEMSPAPEFDVTSTNIMCYNSNSGEIRFNVTNANGYTIAYSIDGGNTYSANPVFSDLGVGTYEALIKYSINGAECFSEPKTITITQADEALTASAGVSELAGCGPSGEGKVRITNPQGGTPPYQYSFDNQASWTNVNEAFVAPGTYTLYIKDANGCVYPMPGIVLEQEPVPPTIGVSAPDYNCDGTASATVTVTNQGNSQYSYTYLLNGEPNTNTDDPKTFLNVPDGNHTISVKYHLETVPTFSNLLYETFGYGDDTTSPGINTEYYCFERQTVETQCNGAPNINDGDYSVTSRIMHPFGTWLQPGDHTPNPLNDANNTLKGRALVVNVGDKIPVTARLYEKEIRDIIPNQPIIVDFWAINLIMSQHNIYDPNLLVALVDDAGNEISSFPTGIIPKSEKWENYTTTLNPGNNTTLKFILRSNVQQVNGNDVAIDDIRVYQLPKTCITEVFFPIVIAPEKAFKADIVNFKNATCFGAADGTITFAAQNFDTTNGFQYSVDGVTWETAMTSPVTITGLIAGDYNIQVRYNNTDDTCAFTLNQKLTESSLLEVTATKIDATCLIDGTIKAKATGGKAAYKYELWDAADANFIENFPSNGILNNVPAGDYTVRVTDANQCKATTTISLVQVEGPTATIATTSDFCYDATNGATIKVTATDGKAPYEYRINGGAFQKNDGMFSNLIPGNYIIVVRDANGCEVTLPEEIIAPQLTLGMTLSKDLDCTVSPDAEITGTIIGGYASYKYAVSFNGGAYTALGDLTGTSFSYAAAAAGTYQFQITDAKGCTTTSANITVDPISPPAFTATPTPILCFGEENGSIKVEIDKTVGAPPFTINVNNDTTGVNYGTQTSGLPAGTYTVTVTDAKSCATPQTVTITQPEAIDFDLTKVDITCNNPGGSSLGSITVENVSGGVGPFTYYITNNFGDVIPGSPYVATSNENHTFNIINYGIYTVTIIDENGCELSKNITMASPPSDLEITIDTTTMDCAADGKATVEAISTIGSGNYEFGILEFNTPPYTNIYVAPDTSGGNIKTFDNLVPGVTYTFVVHDLTTDCYFVKEADMPIPSASSLVSSLDPINVTCKDAADGQIKFTIGDFDSTTTSVDYEIFTAYSNESLSLGVAVNVPVTGTSLTVTAPTLLAPGQYYIVFTENGTGASDGCRSASEIFEIIESILDLSVAAEIVSNANCNPDSGVITATAKGGTAPYLFQINTSATAPDATDAGWDSANTFNVNAGVYYVHVMDANGCIKTIPTGLDLIKDPEPEINVVVDNQCDTAEGDFSITVSLSTSGIAPHSFSINGGAFQTRTTPFTITDLNSGSYTIIVKDVNGCTDEMTVVIDEPLAITPTVTGIVSCSNDDGEITVTATGGTGTYTYAITDGPVTKPSQPSNVFSGLPEGTYEVTITDDKNCTAKANITLEEPTPVDFTLTATDVTCHDGTDGTITVNLPDTNDNPIYTYEIIVGPSTRPAQDSNVFTGLAAGTYTIRVTSGRACIAEKDVEVIQPADIQITALTEVEYLCTAGTNAMNFASISVNTVTGGSGIYTKYEFIKGGVIVQSSENSVYTETDLTGGIYTINVYDDNGCLGSTTAEIKPFISLDALTVKVDTDITCTNEENITVLATSTGGTLTNLEFVLEDYAGVFATQTNTTGVFTGLPIGNYIITVTNLDTHCSIQTVHIVNDPNTFDLKVDTVVDVTCFDALDGSVNVTFVDLMATSTDDKAGVFSYTVDDAFGNPVTSGTTTNAGPITISGLASGTYTITARLDNKPFCAVSKNFTITAPTAALSINTSYTEITCAYDDGTISASATGGWPGGYEYMLTGTTITTIPYSTTSIFTNLKEGIYTVTVRDSSGCEVSETLELKNPDPIVFTADADVTLLSCFGDSNATITATLPTGGQGSNYSYTLNTILPTASSSGPQSSPVFTGLGAGTYSVTVTDGYNCTETSVDIVITQPDPIQPNLMVATTATCDVRASLTLSATGGTGPYTYSTSSTFASVAGAFVNSITFDVDPGTYKYYVRDANGCVSVVTNDIKVDPVPELKIELTGTNLNINCFGDDTGAIVAKAQGGLGNYVYTLLDSSQNPIAGAIQDSPGVFTNLVAGTYYVKVVSDDCIEISKPIEITQPEAPLTVDRDVIPVSCFGGNDGKIVVNATSSGRKIKYAISPQLNQFFDSNVFENLYAGTYQIIVQDEMGCFEILEVTVDQPQPLVVSHDPSSILPEICEGDTDGMFSITISGGTGIYSVSLDDYNGTYTTGTVGQTQFDFTGLKGGNHTVYVRDENGCESELDITFPESVRIEPIAVVEYLCDDNTPGNRVIINVDESVVGSPELDFSLDGVNYQQENVFENLLPGTGYVIYVRHTNGCIQETEPFDIIGYDTLELGIDDGGLNEIVAIATGGTGDYQFTLNGEDYGSTNKFIIRQSGTYTVTVTDSSGCIATATRYFEFIDICIPNYFTPNGDGNQDTWAPGCAVNYPNLEFRIFDRYGREVGTYRQGQAWDGKYRERELPTGDYWYIVKLNDGKDDRDFVGHFTLYR